MPQLEKGGKWVFGWAVIAPDRRLTIPPAAFVEYHFTVGETVHFLHGSRRSGGFAIGRPQTLAQSKIPLDQRIFAHGIILQGGQVEAPALDGVEPGNRLLVVRGSGLALGFLAYGPIHDLARQHPEVEIF